MSKYTDGELPTLENLPSLIANEENCEDMMKLEKCVVAHIEDCEDKTPANLIGSLFKFVRNETPCRNYVKGNGMKIQLSVGTVLAIVLVKFLV
jgi:hypothetical protein